MTIFDKPIEEKPKMKEFMLTAQEKEEIRARMIKSASMETKKVTIDLGYVYWSSLENTIKTILKSNPTVSKDDLLIDHETVYDYQDESEEYFILYSVPRDLEALEEFIEQEEKRVLRKKKADYEQYLKLKGQFE